MDFETALARQFPFLAEEGFAETSPATAKYNCIAAEHARRFQRFSAAEELAAKLEAHLHRQERFAQIDADAMTSGNGAEVYVRGRVSSALAEDLRSTVREFLGESHDVRVKFDIRSE